MPIREDFPLSATNPYGYTKLMLEQILTDLHTADPEWNVTLLRYFNPVGGTFPKAQKPLPSPALP